MYDPEVNRRRKARIKAALPIKKTLIELGAKPSYKNELIVFFNNPKYVRPRGNIWSSKGRIFIRWSNLGPKDVQRIEQILDLQKIPPRNPLRRLLIKGLIQDRIEVEEFYKIVR